MAEITKEGKLFEGVGVLKEVEKAMLAKENFLSQTPSAVTLFCSDELFFFCHPTPRMTRYFTMESGMSSYYVIFSHFPIHMAFLTESRERVSLKLFFITPVN